MNKADLIAKIARETQTTKTAAEKMVNSFMATVKESIKRNETVRLASFGTYSIGYRSARNGRNPKTGEKISIPAKKTVKFKASANFSDYIK